MRESGEGCRIGAALGLLPAEAASLLNREQWREGDVALLELVAARLGVEVPKPAKKRLAELTGSAAGCPQCRLEPFHYLAL